MLPRSSRANSCRAQCVEPRMRRPSSNAPMTPHARFFTHVNEISATSCTSAAMVPSLFRLVSFGPALIVALLLRLLLLRGNTIKKPQATAMRESPPIIHAQATFKPTTSGCSKLDTQSFGRTLCRARAARPAMREGEAPIFLPRRPLAADRPRGSISATAHIQ